MSRLITLLFQIRNYRLRRSRPKTAADLRPYELIHRQQELIEKLYKQNARLIEMVGSRKQTEPEPATQQQPTQGVDQLAALIGAPYRPGAAFLVNHPASCGQWGFGSSSSA